MTKYKWQPTLFDSSKIRLQDLISSIGMEKKCGWNERCHKKWL